MAKRKGRSRKRSKSGSAVGRSGSALRAARRRALLDQATETQSRLNRLRATSRRSSTPSPVAVAAANRDEWRGRRRVDKREDRRRPDPKRLCKDRPVDNRPKGKGSGSRSFVPWC